MTLDLRNRNLTREDILDYEWSEEITRLDLSGNNITNLEGVQFPPNLQTLFLFVNQIINFCR